MHCHNPGPVSAKLSRRVVGELAAGPLRWSLGRFHIGINGNSAAMILELHRHSNQCCTIVLLSGLGSLDRNVLQCSNPKRMTLPVDTGRTLLLLRCSARH